MGAGTFCIPSSERYVESYKNYVFHVGSAWGSVFALLGCRCLIEMQVCFSLSECNATASETHLPHLYPTFTPPPVGSVLLHRSYASNETRSNFLKGNLYAHLCFCDETPRVAYSRLGLPHVCRTLSEGVCATIGTSIYPRGIGFTLVKRMLQL